MKLPMKFARKFKNIFFLDSLSSFGQKIVTAVIKDMKSEVREISGENYVPSQYQILVSAKRKEELKEIDKKVKDQMEELIKNEINKRDFKIQEELKLEFILNYNINKDFIVKGDFLINIDDIDNTEGEGTRVFKSDKLMSNNNDDINHTLKIKPFSEIESYLKLIKNEREVKRFEINSIETNIGRQENNEIVLADPKVSRVHAQIIKKNFYYIINDLNSTNGVLVNGELVESKRLSDGDKIRLGKNQLEFCLKR
ncbi:FHA domain-containing protein [Orenia marismortui]|uniref:Uncharacterized protein DUF2662 n=1 Tax=Orenia marismortui TaxID=46469 RepID=A0A4R8GT30_9FIRM|nr:FHA domain-containing protein [Orenia marismortui]TDX49200.1 uncharacterized protein DUF2662 [Orenia marismortui]